MSKIDQVNLLDECAPCPMATSCPYPGKFLEALRKIAPMDIVEVYTVVTHCRIKKAYEKGVESNR